MASIKLTTYHRDSILNKLMAHRFEEDTRKLAAYEGKTADMIYNDVFSKKERDLIASLPEGWLPKTKYIKAAIGSGSDVNCFYFAGGEERRFPEYLDNKVVRVYEYNDRIGERYTEHQNMTAALEECKNEAKAKARSVIWRASTLGRPLELWPELAPFTVGIEGAEPVNLPAIPLADLNELFELKAA